MPYMTKSLAGWTILGLILVAVLIVLLIWLRWNAKKSGLATASAESPAAAPGLGKKDLVRIWHAFIRHLPWEVRRYFSALPVFVLMGEAGAGKTRLINTCTDWQNQADQLHPSHLASPLMQFYLGSRSVVLEMGAALLTDTRLGAHRAVQHLAKAMPHTRPLQVVLALNADTLAASPPERLRRLAGVMRGKLNLLGGAAGRPPQVTLALTHMDHLTGYAQWRTFLDDQGVALQAVWNTDAPRPAPETVLKPCETLLTKALTTVSASDFLAMVTFLKESEVWLAALDRFVRVLLADDTFSPSPRMRALTLHGRDTQTPLVQPFQAPALTEEARPRPKNRNHQLAAGALLMLGCLVPGSLFLYQQTTLAQLDEKLTMLDDAGTPFLSTYADVHGLFPASSGKAGRFYPAPAFFPQKEQQILARLCETILLQHLYPKLAQLRSEADADEKIIYLLGLAHATPQNGLSAVILDQPRTWARLLGLAPELVEDYARYNTRRPQLGIAVEMLRLGGKEPEHLTEPLRRLEAATGSAFLTPRALLELQTLTAPLLHQAEGFPAHPHLGHIITLLGKIEPFNPRLPWLARREALTGNPALVDLVNAVSTASLAHPEVRGLSLGALMQRLTALSGPAALPHPDPSRLVVGGQSFNVSADAWNQLICRSRITLMMRDFITANQQHPGMIFFEQAGEFPDIRLNGSNDGTFMFTGRATVDGRFSREAFDSRVRPTVEAMDELFNTLPVFPEERQRFRQAVRRHVEWYADRYADEYRRYWSRFRIRADAEMPLRFVLTQIVDFRSPLLELVSTVHTHTTLEIGDNPLLQPMETRLAAFANVRALVPQKDGAPSEWETYRGLISQMRDDLSAESGAGNREKNDDATAFRDFLSPLGRVSYAIQIEASDSYLALCRKWLKSAGISREWQAPFLDPFWSAHALGKREIEQSIAFAWTHLNREYITPLRGRFPFYPGTLDDADPAALAQVIGPRGNFWQSFRLYIAPVCKETDGVWEEHITSQGRIKLPSGMLDTANAVARLTRTLWDQEGMPAALVFSIRPSALPTGPEPDQVAVLSYLRLGQAQVMAFNQRPDWQTLTVDWWKAEPSAVGVAFESPKTHRKTHRELAVEQAHWSFYHLLAKGMNVDRGTFLWLLESPPGVSPLTLEYAFLADPFALFRLPEPPLRFTGKTARTETEATETVDPEAAHSEKVKQAPEAPRGSGYEREKF